MRRTWLNGIFALVLALAIAAGFGSGRGAASPGSQSHAAKKGPFTIGYDIYFLGNSWSVQLYQEFKNAVNHHKADVKNVVYTSADGSAAKQTSNIQSLIAKKVDAIIMTPASPSASVHVIEQAKRAGIPVILLAATANTSDYTSLVTVKDTDFGRVLAQWLANTLHGKGNIYALNGIAGLSTNADRWNGAQSVFKHYPGIHVIASANADWDQAKGQTATANMLSAHPNVNGVWSQGGAMTLGAIQAFQAAGHPLVPMTGELNNGFLKKWYALRKSKTFKSAASTKPTTLAVKALDETLRILKGQKYDHNYIEPAPLITASQLTKYLKPNLPDSVWVPTDLSDAQLRKIFSH
ncbi:MAG TPA: ABC transporter substrate-binding protein [Chloroflexota bacterium]